MTLRGNRNIAIASARAAEASSILAILTVGVVGVAASMPF